MPPLGSQCQLCLPPGEAKQQASRLFSMSGCFLHKPSETKQQSSLCIPTRAGGFFPFSRPTELQKDTQPRVPTCTTPAQYQPAPTEAKECSSRLTQLSPSRPPQPPLSHPCFLLDTPQHTSTPQPSPRHAQHKSSDSFPPLLCPPLPQPPPDQSICQLRAWFCCIAWGEEEVAKIIFQEKLHFWVTFSTHTQKVWGLYCASIAAFIIHW